MTTTIYPNDTPFYATAVPVPIPNTPTDDAQFEKTSSTLNYGILTAQKELSGSEINQLKTQGFTEGLAKSVNGVKASFPLRIWVVDNSGSMAMTDGNRIVPQKNKNEYRVVPCTRWKEIQECVDYHINFSALANAPTSFRLLNNPGIGSGSQEFEVATKGEGNIRMDVERSMGIMSRVKPSGCTPLTEHIWDIHGTIDALKGNLQAEGKRAVIVLATDGLPSNSLGETNSYIKEQFVQSLRALEGLPVWLVIRLSTDEESVVDFYNSLDDQLELSMDVLDDFCGEALEIYEHNPWMNYGLPLHRLREMGFHDRVLDMIDERQLTSSEIRDFCVLLFGECDGLPDPDTDWNAFSMHVKELLSKEDLQWNPVTKRMSPWIDMKQLDRIYGFNDGCVCSIM